MYEVKSNGTTIEFTSSHKEAIHAFDSSSARDKKLLHFISPSKKQVILQSSLIGVNTNDRRNAESGSNHGRN